MIHHWYSNTRTDLILTVLVSTVFARYVMMIWSVLQILHFSVIIFVRNFFNYALSWFCFPLLLVASFGSILVVSHHIDDCFEKKKKSPQTNAAYFSSIDKYIVCLRLYYKRLHTLLLLLKSMYFLETWIAAMKWDIC